MTSSHRFVKTDYERIAKQSLPVVLQRYSILGGDGVDFQIYVDGSAEIVDFLKLDRFEVLHHDLRLWQQDVGYDDGCVKVHSSRVAKPDLQLMDLRCPELLLFDRIKALGWKRGSITEHRSDERRMVFDKNIFKSGKNSRFYFQCVLVLEQLFAKGLKVLKCCERQIYIRSRCPLPPTLCLNVLLEGLCFLRV